MDFDYNMILICLSQKKLFTQDILELTERIKEEAQKEEIHLDELLAERQNRIERIKKCNSMIETQLLELEDSEKIRVRKLLDGEAYTTANADEEQMVELAADTRKYLEQIREIDKAAMALLIAQRDKARKMLIQINKESQSDQINSDYPKQDFLNEIKSLTNY